MDADYTSLDLFLEHGHDFDFEAAIEDAALHAPDVFAELFRRRDEFDLDALDFVEHLGPVWGTAYHHLERGGWRELFEAAGYREDDRPAERPDRPLLLWRGAVPEFRANWSFTDVHDLAHMYASGHWVQDEVGLIWRAVVEPGRLFARFCSEYVVDTDGLAIEPHALWCRCPVDLAPFRGGVEQARVALDDHEKILCLRTCVTRAAG